MKQSVLLIFVSLSFHLFPSNLEAQVFTWELTPYSSPYLDSRISYRLYNETNGSYLDYYSRNTGINLAFNGSLTTANIKIVRPGNQTTQILYGDLVAIHVEHGGYLCYQHRVFGINLIYSTDPQYEWEIRDESYGNSGTPNRNPVETGGHFGIYSTYNNSYLVYGERTYGPNLDWYTIHVPQAPQVTSSAQVNLTYRVGPFPHMSTSGKCSSSILWSFTPVSLTGVDGRADAFNVNNFYNGTENNIGPKEWWCNFNETATNLKSGVWKISVVTPFWRTSCTVTLNSGPNTVNFTQYVSACGLGLNFPH